MHHRETRDCFPVLSAKLGVEKQTEQERAQTLLAMLHTGSREASLSPNCLTTATTDRSLEPIGNQTKNSDNVREKNTLEQHVSSPLVSHLVFKY